MGQVSILRVLYDELCMQLQEHNFTLQKVKQLDVAATGSDMWQRVGGGIGFACMIISLFPLLLFKSVCAWCRLLTLHLFKILQVSKRVYRI